MGRSVKRFGILILLIMLVFTAAACGSEDSGNKSDAADESTINEQETTADTENTAGEDKSLVIYFSRTGEQYKVGVIDKGNTAIVAVADMIANTFGEDCEVVVHDLEDPEQQRRAKARLFLCGSKLWYDERMKENIKKLNISVLDSFPAVDEKSADELLAIEIRNNPMKIVVLDDDPTGVQTVHGVSVYTDWSYESIKSGFAENNKVFYILTNSRGMTADETEAVHRDIAERTAQVSSETGIPYIFMSRSDSTLRGHYPLETKILKEVSEAAGGHIDGEILCPFFKEGGRFTIGNVHYVRQGDELVPAADTEFAKDKTFGYTSSLIPEYIEEKTGGEFKAESTICISLDSLRNMDVEHIENQLMAARDFGKVCLNAVDYCDLKVFSIAFYRAVARGKSFIFRTAAGEVKVLGGITDRPLLTRSEMIVNETDLGGVVVVGSHTQKTTAQLNELLKLECTETVEFDSNKVLEGDAAFYAEVDRCVAEEERIISEGKTAVCYTCRTLLSLENDTKESALQRSVKISDGVQSLVARLSLTPAFIVAKGGITSSDIGTKALAVKRADVMGQIRPGIPVWKTGDESRFPGTPYVIFPGNTGDETALREAVAILTGSDEA